MHVGEVWSVESSGIRSVFCFLIVLELPLRSNRLGRNRDTHNHHILPKLRQQLQVLEYDPEIRLQENSALCITILLTHAFLYQHDKDLNSPFQYGKCLRQGFSFLSFFLLILYFRYVRACKTDDKVPLKQINIFPDRKWKHIRSYLIIPFL